MHEDLLKLDQMIDELKIKYEHYFLGIDRYEPRNKRIKVEKLIRNLLERRETQTAWKFRLSALVNRFNIYSSLWNRTLKRIEEGTYEKEKFRVQLRHKRVATGQAGASPSSPGAASLKEDEQADGVGLDQHKIEEIYNSYLEVRKYCGEDVKDLTLKHMTKALEQQVSMLKKQHGWENVDFKVVIHDGHAALQPLKGEESEE